MGFRKLKNIIVFMNILKILIKIKKL